MTFPYEWNLSDGYPSKGIEPHCCKVFGTFICGGGSTMGYKLAGYEHVGGVEIDPQVAGIYKANHKPKHLYLEDIRAFNSRDDLPKELFNLDLLDGSPPCSSFSMSGSRDKDWGKDKQFREGQVKQRLDDLVYVYIETIKKLQPKVAILENVKGLIQGNAKSYAKKINKNFTDAGYKVQVFLLNGASMGVPQRRERVFFIGVRNDFDVPKLVLNFNEKSIPFREVSSGFVDDFDNKIAKCDYDLYDICDPGKAISTVHPKENRFNSKILHMNSVSFTIASGSELYHPEQKRALQNDELKKIGSYPLDYNFKDMNPQYLIGMSVPPVMTAQISNQIYKQWLKQIKQVAA